MAIDMVRLLFEFSPLLNAARRGARARAPLLVVARGP